MKGREKRKKRFVIGIGARVAVENGKSAAYFRS